jgi:nitric oxide reductase NorE protein
VSVRSAIRTGASAAATAAASAPEHAKRLPGEPGLWIFIAGDTFLFALFFTCFIVQRASNVALYLESQRALDTTIGAVNTVLLLTASWLVVMAVGAARRGLQSTVVGCLSAAIACGGAFAAAKVYEYHAKIAHGVTMLTNDFFMYYFVLTGLHFVHLAIGVIVLAVLVAKARRSIAEDYLYYLESGASYWHMVDLLWIMLFPLLYLVH